MSKDQDALRNISIFIPGVGKGENQGGSLLFVIKRTMQSSFPCFFCAKAGLSVEQVIHSRTPQIAFLHG